MTPLRRLSRGIQLGAALAVAACGGVGPARSVEATPQPPTLTPPTWRTSNDPLSTRLQRTADALGAGVVTPGAFEGSRFLTQGERFTAPVSVPAGWCASILAVASVGIRDIDAAIYEPDGTLLAEDVEPDAHPTVQLCADGEARNAYYTLSAYAGTGEVRYAALLGERASLARVAAAVGGRPGVAGDSGVEVAEDARARSFLVGMGARGYTEVRPEARVALAPSQRVVLSLRVDVGRCYSIAAFASESLSDLDARVLDENGVELVSDSSDAQDAFVQFCAPRDLDARVELTAAGSGGEARVLIYSSAESSAGGTSGLWLGQRPDEIPVRVPVEETFERTRTAAEALGLRAVLPPEDIAVRAAEALTRSARVVRGCTTFTAAAGRGVREVEMWITADGREVASTRAGVRVAATVCADSTRAVSVNFVARGGIGVVRLARFGAARSEEDASTQAARLDAQLGASLDAASVNLGPATVTTVAPSVTLRRPESSGCVRAEIRGVDGARLLSRARAGDRIVAVGAGNAIAHELCTPDASVELISAESKRAVVHFGARESPPPPS